MQTKSKKEVSIPSMKQVEEEREKLRYKKRYLRILRSTLSILITVAAIAVLVATRWMPVLRIYGSSMTPTLSEGNIVVTVKENHFESGDVIAFYYNNKILVKRVIVGPGSWVNIDEDGVVYVDEIPLDEPYLTETALGNCTIDLPYQVPESSWFVMGDHRSTSMDSRSTTVGCIYEEQIVGRVVFRVWPLTSFGTV